MADVNHARIRYDREELRNILAAYTIEPDECLDLYEKSRREGRDRPCQSQVYYGPGHQSSMFCQVRGDHMTHSADLPGGGYAEWKDDHPYSDIGWL